MSIEKHTCYVVACDTCRVTFDELSDEFIVHFDTPDDAIAYITDHGWFLTETGHIECVRCATLAICVRHGHTWGPWIPCRCHGKVPGHHANGCGLFRICQRYFCSEHDDCTLADLPTIYEPIVPGR